MTLSLASNPRYITSTVYFSPVIREKLAFDIDLTYTYESR